MARIKRVNRSVYSEIPLYLNGLLPEERKERLEARFKEDAQLQRALQASRRVRSLFSERPEPRPSDQVFIRVMEDVRRSSLRNQSEVPATNSSRDRATRWLSFASGLALTFSFLLFFWLWIQPGIVLRWNAAQAVSGVTYRIYRADAAHAGEFAMVAEIQGKLGTVEYAFTDSLLIPGRTYLYRVESLAQTGMGNAVQSEWIASSSTGALIALLALLVSSMILGFGSLRVVDAWQEILRWKGSRQVVQT